MSMLQSAGLGRALVAVGSEDCNVCLLHVCPDKVSSAGSLEVLHMLQGHVSSVRALSMCSSCTGRILLFSGGSRASLKVWSVGKLYWTKAALLLSCDFNF